MEQLSTVRASRCTTQKETRRPFIKSFSLASFRQICILLSEFFFPMSHLHSVSKDLKADNSGQTSVNDLLPIIAVFRRHTQEDVTNSRQGARNIFKIWRSTAGAKHLRGRLEKLIAHWHSCAFRFNQCKRRWTIRNWNLVPFPQSIVVWPLNAPNSFYHGLWSRQEKRVSP